MEEKIIAKIQTKTKAKVTPNSTLKELKIDSLDIAELIFDMENELKVTFNDEELTKLQSVQDIVDLVKKTTK
ncbi:phosphopantetheine-binding protein [Mycoplasmopsis columbinasalis]|uniref:Acyl carrier protein n=1 Tax=Mycoplasmopsis columbinasalis TaxID=114880 RepID=A0A449BAP4_9BACT|nr:phosphopantetheine-binding protein [Mycoplasmopsis columbinasalis]VEU78263.1 acyl carrier protein [Mycoplasmopsis columbinasalis]